MPKPKKNVRMRYNNPISELRYCVRCNKPFFVNSNIQLTCCFKCSKDLHKKRGRFWDKKYVKKRIFQNRKRNEDYYNEIKKKIGNKCLFCGFKGKILFHEIHGRKHNLSAYYILEHIENFIPLCFPCHNSLHKTAKHFNIAIRYLEMIQNEKETK